MNKIKKAILALVVILFVFMIMLVLSFKISSTTEVHNTSLTPQTVTQSYSQITDFGLEEIGELATEEYFLTIVQTSESAAQIFGHNIIGTKNRVVFSYDVTIKAGVDFENVKVKVNNKDKTITVTIPEAEIFDVTVDHDSFKSYVEENNLFNPISMDSINASITELEKTARETAIEREIETKAYENARRLIVEFLRNTSNLDGYIVVVK